MLIFYINKALGIIFKNEHKLNYNLSMRSEIAEIIAGHIAGWSVITVGQPLDYLKTQYQLNKPILFRYLLNYKHFNILYRGSSSLYLFSGSVAALQFIIFQKSKSFFDSLHKSQLNYFLAGGVVGSTISFLYTPNDFVKIQAQISKQSKPQGSIRRLYDYIFKQSFSQGIKKIYTGLGWCLIKEIPGSSIYYGCFHFYRSTLFNKSRDQADLTAQICSGSLAGLTYQLYSYPIDVFKTNCQAQGQTFKQLIKRKFWKEQSYRKGFGFSIARSMITDAVAFTVYENVRTHFQKETVF